MPERRSRRRFLTLLAGAPFAAGALAACSPTAGQPVAPSPVPSPAAAPAALEPVVVTTEQVVGKNRFSLALVDPASGVVNEADVKIRFYKVDPKEGTGQLRAEAAAPYHGAGLEDKGVYVAHPDFDEPGPWGLEVIATPKGAKSASVGRANFTVLRQSQTIPVGGVAPKTRQVLAGEPGIARHCTAEPACPMHDVRIADSIAAGRPSLILFAAPGWCPSQTCAPELNVVQQLRAKYGDRLDCIHVEIYQDEAHSQLTDAVREWKLTTEPWVFLVGRDGTVRAKYEGGATADEIAPDVDAMLA